MNKALKLTWKLLILTIGAVIYAAAISFFLNPTGLAPGGISGIAIIVNTLTGFSTGAVMFLINIPLMILALIKFGRVFFLSTSYVIAVSSVATDIITRLIDGRPLITENLLLAGFAGGTLLALGMGIVFRAGATTGGSDILVKLLRRRYRHINTGTIFFISDFTVIAASALAFRNVEIALFALLTVFISSKVLDFVLYGLDRGKLVYIISESSERISQRIIRELETGVTLTNGVGVYSGTEKGILLCAVKNQTFPKLRKIVEDEDSSAFIIVSDTAEIIGEGYKSIKKEDL